MANQLYLISYLFFCICSAALAETPTYVPYVYKPAVKVRAVGVFAGGGSYAWNIVVREQTERTLGRIIFLSSEGREPLFSQDYVNETVEIVGEFHEISNADFAKNALVGYIDKLQSWKKTPSTKRGIWLLKSGKQITIK